MAVEPLVPKIGYNEPGWLYCEWLKRAKKPQQPFRYMDLPTEIRANVLENLFADDQVHLNRLAATDGCGSSEVTNADDLPASVNINRSDLPPGAYSSNHLKEQRPKRYVVRVFDPQKFPAPCAFKITVAPSFAQLFTSKSFFVEAFPIFVQHTSIDLYDVRFMRPAKYRPGSSIFQQQLCRLLTDVKKIRLSSSTAKRNLMGHGQFQHQAIMTFLPNLVSAEIYRSRPLAWHGTQLFSESPASTAMTRKGLTKEQAKCETR